MVDTRQHSDLHDLVAADLDGDGLQDVIASTGSPGTSVSVLLGDGQGGLVWSDTEDAPAPSIGAAYVSEIAVLDVDGDGLLDVVTSGTERGPAGHDDQGLLLVFAGDGLGGLQPPYPVHLPHVPLELEVADLDGDDLPDLVTRADTRVLVLLRRPGGGFAPPAITSVLPTGLAWDLEVGDVDGDQDPDVLTVVGYRVWLLRNAGDGTLLPAQLVEPSSPTSEIALADFDGDARLDFARWWHGSPSSPAELSFHIGNGSGGFTPLGRLRMGAGGGMEVVDLDGDGLSELLVPIDGGMHRLRLRAGEVVNEGPLHAWPWLLTAADFDGDDLQDLITFRMSDQNRASVSVVLSVGDGTLRDVVASPSGFGGTLHALHDLDGDGHLDALGWSADRRLWIAPGRGQGHFGPARQFRSPTGVGGLFAGDFDGDGIEDLAVQGYLPHSVSLLLGRGDLSFGTGTTLDLTTLSASAYASIGAAAGDVDGDGRTELVLHAPGRDATAVLGEADGRFVVEGWLVTPRAAGPWSLRDVDGDGVSDVVYLSFDPGTGTSLWAFGRNPVGGWGPSKKLLDLPVAWLPGRSSASQAVWNPVASWLQIADLDGDGHEDVLAQREVSFLPPSLHWTVSEVATWKGLSGGAWTPPQEWRINSRLGGRRLLDLDGDGVQDVVFDLSGYVPCTGVWRPAGGFLEPVPERYAFGPSVLADLDGDGRADALSATGGLLVTHLNRSARER